MEVKAIDVDETQVQGAQHRKDGTWRKSENGGQKRALNWRHEYSIETVRSCPKLSSCGPHH